MEENYQTLLRMKENQLIKAFEKNQMSCMIVKDENELKQYLRTVLKESKESCCRRKCHIITIRNY